MEAGHLLSINSSNHLRRANSSLMGDKMGLGPTMTAKDSLQCLFRVLVECGGQDQHGINVDLKLVPMTG